MTSPRDRDRAGGQRRAEKLQLHLRVQSALLMASIVVLALTGLPQKFDSLSLSRQAMEMAGGIESLRLVHHLAGGVLIFAGAYHVALILTAILIFRMLEPLRTIPGGADLREATLTIRHFVGLGPAPRPRTRRYLRKMDYWFMGWSLGAMAVSGLVALFSLDVARLFSGDVVATAQSVHSRAAPLVVVWALVFHFLYVGWLPSVQPAAETPPLQAPTGSSLPTVSPAPRSGAVAPDLSEAHFVGVSSSPVSTGDADPEAPT